MPPKQKKRKQSLEARLKRRNHGGDNVVYVIVGTRRDAAKRKWQRPEDLLVCYTGSTVNVKRRHRQHNGEINGGSKYCRSIGKDWKAKILVHGFPTYNMALSFETHCKHEARDAMNPDIRKLGMWARKCEETRLALMHEKHNNWDTLWIEWFQEPHPTVMAKPWPRHVKHVHVYLGDKPDDDETSQIPHTVVDTRTSLARFLAGREKE